VAVKQNNYVKLKKNKLFFRYIQDTKLINIIMLGSLINETVIHTIHIICTLRLIK